MRPTARFDAGKGNLVQPMPAWTVRKNDVDRPLVVLGCALFVAALQFSYVFMDVKLFPFFGLRLTRLDPLWLVLGFLMALVPSLWLPARLSRPSQVAYWVLYLTVIVPAMWIPYQTLDVPPHLYLAYSGVLLGCFYGLGFSHLAPRWHVKRPVVHPDYFFFALTAIAIVFTLAVWSTNGFHIEIGLQDMYNRRKEAKSEISAGSIMSYLKGNLTSALQPYTFALGITRGSLILVCISVWIGLVGFSVEGSKTSAAIPFLLLAMYPFLTRFRAKFGIAISIAAGIAVLVVIAAYSATHIIGIPVVTTWRLFEAKGLLSGFYWDFFTTHPKALMADGFLRGLIHYPYPYPVSQQIGLTYFGSADTNANANLWASAFGDFGYLGMIAETVLLAMLFRLIDSISLNRGFLIPAFLCAFLGMKLSDVALDTSILSHGTLAILVFLYILPPMTKAPLESPVLQEPTGATA